MRSLSVIFPAITILVFFFIANAQDHTAHHPEQTATVQADTSAGMGMMPGGMMSQQGMHSMCGKMMKGGMMGSKGMMGGQGMMSGGMMGQMHGQGVMGHHDPMHRYMHLVYHLPGMKTKLELTDDQLGKLKTIRSDFLKRKADWDANVEKKQIDLDALLDKDAAPGDVGKILKSINDVKLEMKLASYETAQKMKAVLSPDQLERLDEMCPMCMGSGMMGGKR